MWQKSIEAEINNIGYAEFMELVDYVGQNVTKVTNGEQIAWLLRKGLLR